MVAKTLMKRGSKVYGTGVKGAHKLVSVGVRTPLRMGIQATKGLPIVPKGLKMMNKTVGAGLNTGFGFIAAVPRMAGRGGALLLSPVRQAPMKKRKSPKRKSKRK